MEVLGCELDYISHIPGHMATTNLADDRCIPYLLLMVSMGFVEHSLGQLLGESVLGGLTSVVEIYCVCDVLPCVVVYETPDIWHWPAFTSFLLRNLDDGLDYVYTT